MSVYPKRRSQGPLQASPARDFLGGAGRHPANDNLRAPANDFGPAERPSYYSSKFGGIRGGLWALEERLSVGAALLDLANQVFVYELQLAHSSSWTVGCDTRGVCTNYTAASGWYFSNTAWACSSLCTGGALAGIGGPPINPQPSGQLASYWEAKLSAGTTYAWRCRASASSPNVETVLPEAPSIAPSLWPVEVPDVPVWVDPFSQPVRGPSPAPVPPPYWAQPLRQPNPWRSPSEQPQRGPSPKARPRPRVRPEGEPAPIEWVPSPDPVVEPAPAPDGAPWVRPGHNAHRRPGRRGRPLAGGHVRRPPGPNEKERKGALPGPLAAAMKAAFAATEANDAIGAIYAATGTPAQRKAWEAKHGSTPQAKAAFIYNNADAIDLSDAAMNLIANEIGDRIVGRVSGGAGDFLRGIGNTGGGLLL